MRAPPAPSHPERRPAMREQQPDELQSLLDAVAEHAAHASGADDVIVSLRDGDVTRAQAHYGPLLFVRGLTIPIDRGNVVGRVVLDGKTIQTADILAEPNEPLLRALA